jgi:hypothetical protein
MNSEHRVVVPNVMVVYAKNSCFGKALAQIKMMYDWFMDYYAVRAVVGHGTEIVMDHLTSTKSQRTR